MKKSKYTDEQIAFALKQAESGVPVAEVCRKMGISGATFYNGRTKFAGLLPSEGRRLKQLEEENAKPKRLVADLSLDRTILTRQFNRASSGNPLNSQSIELNGVLRGQEMPCLIAEVILQGILAKKL